MAQYPLVNNGTPAECFTNPSDMVAYIVANIKASLAITGTIVSQDEPDVGDRDKLWTRLNANGSIDAQYTYWATGPSGANWYRKEPYFIGQVSIFESGAPSVRWVACDGTNGTFDYRSRLVGCTGTGTGLTLRSLGAITGVETVVLTEPQLPIVADHVHAISAIPNLDINGGSSRTLAVVGGSTTMDSNEAGGFGGDQAHDNMSPSIFVPYFRYAGPVWVVPGS